MRSARSRNGCQFRPSLREGRIPAMTMLRGDAYFVTASWTRLPPL